MSKPFWQRDFFVTLVLLVFWPVGIFLMWKYASWRNWAKGVLTAFFLIGAIPIFFIWTLVFGLKGYSFVRNIANPRVVNQSNLYTCKPVNSNWGKCVSTKYGFSFEYPAGWSFIDLRPEGIGFSPVSTDIQDNFVISMEPSTDWKTSDQAKQFADGFLGPTSRQVTTIDGLYATKDYKAFTDSNSLFGNVVIVDGTTTYQFMSTPANLKKVGSTLNNSELQTILDHMAGSFVK